MQRIGNLALFMPSDDRGKRLCLPMVRIDAINFEGFDQQDDHSPVLGTCVVPSEKGLLAVHGAGSGDDSTVLL